MARQSERSYLEQAVRGVVLLVAMAVTFLAGALVIAATMSLVVD